MNKILNRFFTVMPSNTVYGWGTKINNIDLMRVIATSKHKRKFRLFDTNYPWTVKIKYVDNYRNLNHPQITSGTHNHIFISPFTAPIINHYIDPSPSGTDNIVITYRFKDEVQVDEFINNLKSDIDNINECIEDGLTTSEYMRRT